MVNLNVNGGGGGCNTVSGYVLIIVTWLCRSNPTATTSYKFLQLALMVHHLVEISYDVGSVRGLENRTPHASLKTWSARSKGS